MQAHGFGTPVEVTEMRDSAALLGDAGALHERLSQDGYLMIRGLLDRDAVLAARADTLDRLRSVDEVDAQDRATGRSVRSKLPDPGRWMQDVCEQASLRRVTHHGPIHEFWRSFFNEEPRAFDFVWMRIVKPGPATAIHVDSVFMNRGSGRLYTTWTPIGDTPLEMGPLAVLPGSHVAQEVRDWASHDVDRDARGDGGSYAMFPDTHAEIAGRLGLSWHSADFRAGDVVIFTMTTAHCGLDNTTDRIRISTDTRFQPASDPADDRWVGAKPLGHNGRGYADMAGVARM